MALTVNFYILSKRANSTKRPSGSPSASYSCSLKDGCSVLAPELKLRISADPSALNYAYIPTWSRYYYVTDWTWERGEWTASLTCDELATWKTEIGASSLYVLRSAADKNGTITDGMYPIEAGIVVEDQPYMLNNAIEYWWNTYSPSGTGVTAKDGGFVVGVLSYSDSNSTFGGVNYLFFTPAQMQNFLKAIYTPGGNPMSMDYAQEIMDQYLSGGNLTTEAVSNFSYTLENPFTDYIKSVMWIPAQPGSLSGPKSTFYFGHNEFTYTDNGTSCYTFDPSASIVLTAGFDVPQHPLATTRGVYLNAQPFTESYLLLPRVGVVRVDNSLYAASNAKIRLELQLDPISGVGVYVLYASAEDAGGVARQIEVSRWSAQIGVNVALSETKDPGETLNAMLSAVHPVASLLTGDVAGAITGAGAAITNIARSQETGGGTIGSNDGWLGLMGDYRTPHLMTIFHAVADDDNANNGRPLCQVRQLSTLAGYQKIQDGDVEIPGQSGEQETVRGYLEGGYYYE